jgi:hypothetical protein
VRRRIAARCGRAHALALASFHNSLRRVRMRLEVSKLCPCLRRPRRCAGQQHRPQRWVTEERWRRRRARLPA